MQYQSYSRVLELFALFRALAGNALMVEQFEEFKATLKQTSKNSVWGFAASSSMEFANIDKIKEVLAWVREKEGMKAGEFDDWVASACGCTDRTVRSIRRYEPEKQKKAVLFHGTLGDIATFLGLPRPTPDYDTGCAHAIAKIRNEHLNERWRPMKGWEFKALELLYTKYFDEFEKRLTDEGDATLDGLANLLQDEENLREVKSKDDIEALHERWMDAFFLFCYACCQDEVKK